MQGILLCWVNHSSALSSQPVLTLFTGYYEEEEQFTGQALENLVSVTHPSRDTTRTKLHIMLNEQSGPDVLVCLVFLLNICGVDLDSNQIRTMAMGKCHQPFPPLPIAN